MKVRLLQWVLLAIISLGAIAGCATSPQAQAQLDENQQRREELIEQRVAMDSQLDQMRSMNAELQEKIEDGQAVDEQFLDDTGDAVEMLTEGLLAVQSALQELSTADETIKTEDKKDQGMFWAQLAGVALGAGGLSSRFGPSRSKAAIEALQAKVEYAERMLTTMQAGMSQTQQAPPASPPA